MANNLPDTEPFRIDKAAMRRAFDRAASTYDLVAVLQREVADHMAQRLQYIKLEPAAVLDAGAGTGYGSRLLRERYPKTQLVALDIAMGMLKAARGVMPWWRGFLPGRTRDTFVCADLEHLPLGDASVDMVWSNLSLQWCNDLDAVFSDMRRVLAPNGLFSFTTFGPDTLKELRQAFSGIDTHTHVSRFVDMHDVGDALIRAGFAEPVMDIEYFTLTYDTLRELMHDLKALGAHNATQGRPHGLSGKAGWRRLEANYEALRRDGKLPLTYEVVYGHAWRGTKEVQTKRGDGAQVVQFTKRI
jgi:malonyl-CoA O-methyltransferase